MESTAFVALWPTLSVLRFASAKLAEILRGSGSDIGEELHLDPTERFAYSFSIRRPSPDTRQ